MTQYQYPNPDPPTTALDSWNATMQDVGDFASYVGGSAYEIFEAVSTAPFMAADGLNKGVQGLPLPGHAPTGFAEPSGSGLYVRQEPYGETTARWESYGSLGSAAKVQAPSRVGGPSPKARFATMATANTSLDSQNANHTFMRAAAGLPPSGGLFPASPLATLPSSKSGRPPSPTTARPPFSPGQQVPTVRQPSMKVSGGLGLPRAGFSSSLGRRSLSPQPGSPDDAKPRLSGYYGQDKTGGMSVA